MDIKKAFAKYHGEDGENEYLKFGDVTDRLSNRPDLNAFMLLDKLCPTTDNLDIIGAVGHDVVYISTSIEELSEVATEEDICTLVRCGVMLDEETDSLFMFC